MSNFDWNQMRGFLATAETGSLSAAARKLGLTQPTLSRQVAALEEEMGVTLFERVGKGLQLTDTGLDMLEHARAMGSAADMLALSASGRSQAVEGLVSISASDGFAVNVLPSIVARIRQEAPGIRVEIVASNALSDLRRREADIAIRHVRPEEPDLIAKRIRDGTAGFYAAKSWVQAHGHPRTAEEAAGLPYIGFDRTGRLGEHLRGIGIQTGEPNFPVLSENSVACWELARQGLGVCIMMDDIAQGFDDMVRVLEDVQTVTFPIWLVTHRELRTSRRIRVVFDLLAEALDTVTTATGGPDPAI